ncbi:unnamed protein product [Amoebophrya sp. A120]|nr:unnamed protein product [Amoebophrya sp. A120]|eukprot:GSA120T00012438001.1
MQLQETSNKRQSPHSPTENEKRFSRFTHQDHDASISHGDKMTPRIIFIIRHKRFLHQLQHQSLLLYLRAWRLVSSGHTPAITSTRVRAVWRGRRNTTQDRKTTTTDLPRSRYQMRRYEKGRGAHNPEEKCEQNAHQTT